MHGPDWWSQTSIPNGPSGAIGPFPRSPLWAPLAGEMFTLVVSDPVRADIRIDREQARDLYHAVAAYLGSPAVSIGEPS